MTTTPRPSPRTRITEIKRTFDPSEIRRPERITEANTRGSFAQVEGETGTAGLAAAAARDYALPKRRTA